jgi:hypothetical protein
MKLSIVSDVLRYAERQNETSNAACRYAECRGVEMASILLAALKIF